MSTIYKTREHNGHGKQNYYHNEYRDEGDNVNIYRCNRHKEFDGRENNWVTGERKIGSINKSDNNMPGWLRDIIK